MKAHLLQQVTRVKPIEIKTNRSRTLQKYLRRTGATLALGSVAPLVVGCLGESVARSATVLVSLLTLAAFGYLTARLVRTLTRPPLYILNVATAGTVRRPGQQRPAADLRPEAPGRRRPSPRRSPTDRRNAPVAPHPRTAADDPLTLSSPTFRPATRSIVSHVPETKRCRASAGTALYPREVGASDQGLRRRDPAWPSAPTVASLG